MLVFVSMTPSDDNLKVPEANTEGAKRCLNNHGDMSVTESQSVFNVKEKLTC